MINSHQSFTDAKFTGSGGRRRDRRQENRLPSSRLYPATASAANTAEKNASAVHAPQSMRPPSTAVTRPSESARVGRNRETCLTASGSAEGRVQSPPA